MCSDVSVWAPGGGKRFSLLRAASRRAAGPVPLAGERAARVLLELRLPAQIERDRLLGVLDVGVKGDKRPWNCKSFSRSQFFSRGWKLFVTNCGDDATCSPFRMSEERGMFSVAFLELPCPPSLVRGCELCRLKQSWDTNSEGQGLPASSERFTSQEKWLTDLIPL